MEMTGFSSRKFGVEIECYFPNSDNVFEAWNKIKPLGWTKDFDGSLDTKNLCGREFKSPILSGIEGIEELKTVLSVLNKHDATVDRTCGLHVHVDARAVDLSQCVAVAARYTWFQGQIDQLMTKDRRSEECYSLPFEDCEIKKLLAWIRSYNSLPLWVQLDRQMVNLNSLSYHGTVEFRQHGGCLDFSLVAAWVGFCVDFFEWTVNNCTVQHCLPIHSAQSFRKYSQPDTHQRNEKSGLKMNYGELFAGVNKHSKSVLSPLVLSPIIPRLEHHSFYC